MGLSVSITMLGCDAVLQDAMYLLGQRSKDGAALPVTRILVQSGKGVGRLLNWESSSREKHRAQVQLLRTLRKEAGCSGESLLSQHRRGRHKGSQGSLASQSG